MRLQKNVWIRKAAVLGAVVVSSVCSTLTFAGGGIVSEAYIRTQSPVASETSIDVTSGRARIQIIANSTVTIELRLGRITVAQVSGADLRLGAVCGPAHVVRVEQIDANQRRYTFDLVLTRPETLGTGTIGVLRVKRGGVLFDEDPIIRRAIGG